MAFEGPVRRILGEIFTKERAEKKGGEEVVFDDTEGRIITPDVAPVTWVDVEEVVIDLGKNVARIWCVDSEVSDEAHDMDVVEIRVEPEVAQHYSSPIIAFPHPDNRIVIKAKDPNTKPLKVRYAFERRSGEKVLVLSIGV